MTRRKLERGAGGGGGGVRGRGEGDNFGPVEDVRVQEYLCFEPGAWVRTVGFVHS